MENTTNITSKNIKKIYCEKCDFRCFKKGDFNRHLNSKKHNTTNTTKIQPKILHHCECGKNMPIALPFSVRLFQVVLFFLFQQLLR